MQKYQCFFFQGSLQESIHESCLPTIECEDSSGTLDSTTNGNSVNSYLPIMPDDKPNLELLEESILDEFSTTVSLNESKIPQNDMSGKYEIKY